jgi:phosphonate transport system substrate-binding protein
VANGQVDLATDYDRNLNSMIERNLIAKDSVKVIWTSDPLPNDALAVRQGFDPALIAKVREAALTITEDQAKTIMPTHYTGWIAATHGSYKMIDDAGIAIGIIKQK